MSGLLLVAGFCLLLCLLAGAGLLLSRLQARERRVGDRLRMVTGAHTRQAPAPIRPIARAAVARKVSTAARLAAIFGYNKAHASHHALPWWLVLALTGAFARGLTMLAQGVMGPPLALAATPVAWVVLSRSLFGLMTERRIRQLVTQFPDALNMIVRAVRVGMPVSEAMRLVGREAQEPTATEFALTANELQIGTPLDEAIRTLAERTGVAEYQFFATALSLQAQTGGGLTETLEGLADVIRKRLALKAKGAAMASEARASAVVLALLPFVTFGGMMILNKPYIEVMYTTDQGMRMLGIGAAMLLVGILAMRSIIRRSLA
jgi:tight adherence protein B